MATRICKRFTFEAAHHLPQHDGKCQRPHGHTYTVELHFAGDPIIEGPKTGMVIDFGDVTAMWKQLLEPHLDHRNLNETLQGIGATTAENIARWIYRRLRAADKPPPPVPDDEFGAWMIERVRVWETQSSWAEFPA